MFPISVFRKSCGNLENIQFPKSAKRKILKKKEKWKYSIEIEKENNPQKIAILVYRFWIFCEQNNKDLWTKNKKLYINNWNVGIWSILPSSRNPTRNVLSGEFEVWFPGSQNRIHVLGRGFCLEFLKVPYGMRDVKKFSRGRNRNKIYRCFKNLVFSEGVFQRNFQSWRMKNFI